MKIAIIGDVHGFWNENDTDYFNSSDYDYILFTGDLRSFSEKEDSVAKRISRLRKKSFLIPGNADTSSLFQLAGETFRIQFLIQMSKEKQKKRIEKMKDALGEIELCAYEKRLLQKNSISVNLIVLRPFAMGVYLSYAPILKKQFGIHSIEDSKERIKQVIDSCQEESIVFLGHNGPFGLGSDLTSLWSSDFTKEPLDYGDVDYSFAIDYAKSKGKKVLAAIAGHLHHKINGTKLERNWLSKLENTHYINAAKVPRIFSKENKTFRHHIELEISNDNEVKVNEILAEE